jgi:hypothetical protein
VLIEQACLALRVGVGLFGPEDRLPIATRHQEQPLADGRCAIVARPKLSPLDVIAEVAKLSEPRPESEAATHWARTAVVGERPPVLEFFDVLEDDDARLDGLRPAHHDPGEAADPLVDRLAALRLTEMLAVWREPSEPHRPTFTDLDGIDVPHVFAEVLGGRTVRRVHCDGFAVVVDRDVRRASERPLDSERRSAATGEVVNDQFICSDSVRKAHIPPSVLRASQHPPQDRRQRLPTRLFTVFDSGER